MWPSTVHACSNRDAWGGDRIGRRRLLLIGAAGYGIASVAAAFAPNAGLLIGTRAVMGVEQGPQRGRYRPGPGNLRAVGIQLRNRPATSTCSRPVTAVRRYVDRAVRRRDRRLDPRPADRPCHPPWHRHRGGAASSPRSTAPPSPPRFPRQARSSHAAFPFQGAASVATSAGARWGSSRSVAT